ncbi:protein phosphatase 1 regulatory subunit INH3-like [Phragmites australis]|uniref:protein phosphatase 1 regulatory subunit INH3-like n=1 Tax=Phragmites australis TaxID=29695 RepID=UPI002D77CE36|nr:protein phosphatase 1 regulatory subunit INH3-like [Phragmites australis]
MASHAPPPRSLSTGSVTVTVEPSPSSSSSSPPAAASALAPPSHTVVLRLKRRAKKKVTWKEGTVDNEFLGRKSSKKCCVFLKEVPFDEDCSDDEGPNGRGGGRRCLQGEAGEGTGSGGGGCSSYSHDHNHHHH